MHHFSRYIHLASVLLLVVCTCLSGCSRTAQPYLHSSDILSYECTTPALESNAKVKVDEPAPGLTASISDEPLAPVSPAWKAAEAPSEPAQIKAPRSSIWHSYQPLLVNRQAAAPECDQIVLRNGDLIDAKVKEVGVNEVRYKKCDRPDGPDYTISKRDILSIKYSNGEVERFSSDTSTQNNNNVNSDNRQPSSNGNSDNQRRTGPRTDPFAIVAIAAGGLAIFTGLGSILLGAAAVVFGALSLSRIRKEPNRFKGKGLALAGMIAGIVAAAAIVLYVFVL